MEKKELIRAVKFTLFSISAGVIELGTFALLNELLRLPYWLSYVTALTLSVLWNFTLNRKFTFQSGPSYPDRRNLAAEGRFLPSRGIVQSRQFSFRQSRRPLSKTPVDFIAFMR